MERHLLILLRSDPIQLDYSLIVIILSTQLIETIIELLFGRTEVVHQVELSLTT